MRIFSLLATLSVTIAIVACTAGSGRFSHSNYTAFYSPSLVSYVVQSGFFPLELYGAPFGAEANNIIVEDLRMPAYYRNAPLKLASDLDQAQNGRLVLVMDAEKLVNVNVPCIDPKGIALRQAKNEKLVVQATFCYQDEMVSRTVLTMDRPAGPSEPEFRQAMKFMMEYLFPPFLPNGPGCGAASPRC